jgi:catechol 2,3-dioxygenase-like lactoylglutathione lyase family enzyme
MSRRAFFQITLLVRDYDEAIDFYTKTLDFKLLEDTKLTDTKRWVVVAPPGGTGGQLLLAKATGEAQINRIGDQTGGRVFLFMHTDNLQEDLVRLKKHGVKIVRGPVKEPFGDVLVFEDLYGNLWDLIEKNNI